MVGSLPGERLRTHYQEDFHDFASAVGMSGVQLQEAYATLRPCSEARMHTAHYRGRSNDMPV